MVLQELERPDISWSDLDTWEEDVAKKITQDLGGVPGLVRLVNQLVGKMNTRKRKVDVAVQTDVSSL